jgi:hypothetical protein
MKKSIIFIIFLNFSLYAQGLNINYKFDFHLKNEKKSISGKETVKIINNSQITLKEIYFHNNSNGYYDSTPQSPYTQINSVKCDNKDVIVEGINSISMKILPDRTISTGDSIKIEIEFETKVSEYPNPFCPTVGNRDYNLIFFYPVVEYFYEDGWHPETYKGKADPVSNFSDYEVIFTIPKEFTIATSGFEIKREENEHGTTFYYHSSNAISFSAIIAPNRIIRKETIQGIEIELSYPPENFTDADKLIKRMEKLIPFYTEEFGPCPNKKLTITQADRVMSGGGAMATANYIVFQKKIRGDDFVIDHEFAHQWFGNSINADENTETWLNEAFADYATFIFQEKTFGKEESLPQLKLLPDFWSDIKDITYSQINLFIMRSFQEEKKLENVYTPERETNFENISDNVAKYQKGARVLIALRNSIGDSIMKKIMKTYVSNYSYKTVNTSKFISVVGEIAGKRYEDFLWDYIKTNKKPEFVLTKVKSSETKDGLYLNEVVFKNEGDLIAPAELFLKFSNSETKTLNGIWTEKVGATTTILYPSVNKITEVIIDPKETYIETKRWNNKFSKTIKFRFLLGTLSNDIYQIFYIPTFSFNSIDKFRIGISLNGSYGLYSRPFFPSDNYYSFSIKFDYGFGGKTFGYDLEFGHPIEFLKNFRFNLKTTNRFGFNKYEVNLDKYIKTNYIFEGSKPKFTRLTSGFSIEEVKDNSTYLNSNNWDKGRKNFLFLKLKNFDDRGSIWHFESFYLEHSNKSFGSDNDFTKISIDGRFEFFLSKKLGLQNRIFFGTIFGQTKLQDNFYLFGKNEFDKLDSQGKSQIAGEGDLRGYFNRYIKDKNIFTYNFDLRYKIFNATKLILFFDWGTINKNLSFKKNFSNGGLGAEIDIKYIIYGIYFPVWISKPDKNKKNFGFRFITSLEYLF